MFKKTTSLSFEKEPTNKEKFLIVEKLRQKYPLSTLLEVSNLDKQTYYYNKRIYTHDEEDSGLTLLIEKIYFDNNCYYGYRRITEELKKQGIVVNHKKVLKILNQIKEKKSRKNAKYSSFAGDFGGKPENIVNRNFVAERPNQKWATDVTEFKCVFGKLYLSVMIDLYAGDVVAYSVSRHPDYELVNQMLESAFEKYKNIDGLIIHSDMGWQYQYYKYKNTLQKYGIIQSMSRKGNCIDNSPVESFFGTLKNEIFYNRQHMFKTFNQLTKSIDIYIDYYNNKRIKNKLKGMSPMQFRNLYKD